mmetsp:Transcript_34555/g.83602  ORF Transcript_34555/g.83602 Transcript_34555/m.83602 type:complete len:91 (-) Transcript_34555:34-306(-)
MRTMTRGPMIGIDVYDTPTRDIASSSRENPPTLDWRGKQKSSRSTAAILQSTVKARARARARDNDVVSEDGITNLRQVIRPLPRPKEALL